VLRKMERREKSAEKGCRTYRKHRGIGKRLCMSMCTIERRERERESERGKGRGRHRVREEEVGREKTLYVCERGEREAEADSRKK